jgi:pantoate--beta-alanine ligase
LIRRLANSVKKAVNIATTIHDARLALLPWRKNGDTVALVPTMGALHRGHMSLIEHAQKITQRVVVSVFVNPLQFGANEDLANYPRSPDADKVMLEQAGCDLLFMPSVDEMYPDGFATSVNPGDVADILEGAIRPGHFHGVATIVTKLLMQLMPDAALFGEKDYQQYVILDRVTSDLNIPTHIIPMPTIRDADGLAMSSRNVYLSPAERTQAVNLPQILIDTAKKIHAGTDIGHALSEGQSQLNMAGIKIDYFELVNANNLKPVRTRESEARLMAAVRVGKTRLIDNVAITAA